MGCDCGKPKCDGHCGVSPAVLQINNPSECVLFHRVEVPASMGDSKTNPPKSGAYKNVLLYYEADQTSWLYSSDGIPQKLVNGLTDYEDAINLPQINGVTLLGDKSSADLELADAPMVITIASGNAAWSGADTAEDIYNFFLNQGKVNVVFEGSDNYGYEIVSAAYIPGEQKMMCMTTVASLDAGSSPVEFTNSALYGLMTFYTVDKAVDVGELDLQPKLFITDFTGLSMIDGNVLEGVPATNASIGMVKPGDGLSISSDGTLAVIDHVFDTVADMKDATNLVNGSYAQTLGFHSLNDGGGALYKITDSGTANEMDVIAVGSLYANIQLDKEITLENFGAYGDDTHDDSDILQAVINYSVDNGLLVKTLPKTYKVTKTIDVPNGTKIEGVTPNSSLQTNWNFTTFKAAFENTDTTNTDPVFNLSNDGKNVYSNFPSSTANRTGIQVKNIKIDGQGAFCGVKLRGYGILIDNVSIERCKIGMHIYRAFVCCFTAINIFFCEIGIYNVNGVGNAIYRDMYITYGSNILTDTDVSTIVQNTFGTQLRTTKICGVYLTHSRMTMENCCLEAVYYGVYLRYGSLFQATYLSVEAIPTGGAVISDYSSDTPNYVRIDNLNLYNNENYGGSICNCAYRSQYYIHSNIPKPANFADPTMSTRGVMKVEFSDWEYVLPVNIKNITGIDVTNNHTKFNDNGNIDVDFVVNDYTSQDSGLSSKLVLGNLAAAGYNDTGYIPMLGVDYRLNTATQNFSKNSDGTYVDTPKKTRYCFELSYTA